MKNQKKSVSAKVKKKNLPSEDGGFEESFFERTMKPVLYFSSSSVALIVGYLIYALLK